MAERGQPTKYNPKYCEMLIEHMKEGLSFECFAAVAKVHRDTLYEWVKVHKDFSDAKKRGTDEGLYFYEKFGVAGMAGKVKNFNVTAWIFSMKNRFQWADRADISIDDVRPTKIERLDGRILELGVVKGSGE